MLMRQPGVLWLAPQRCIKKETRAVACFQLATAPMVIIMSGK